jgi:hypothetical protein
VNINAYTYQGVKMNSERQSFLGVFDGSGTYRNCAVRMVPSGVSVALPDVGGSLVFDRLEQALDFVECLPTTYTEAKGGQS